MTRTTITIKNRTTGESKIVDCGVEFQDYTFVSECQNKVMKENPGFDFVSRSSVSDKAVNFVRPLTYGF